MDAGGERNRDAGDADGPVARARVRALEASKVREVANAGLGTPGIARFWFGEGDEAASPEVREAAISALRAGRTFYTHNLGNPELRDALAAYLSGLHGRNFAAEDVVVTSSGVSALMIAMQAIVEPGDRVVVVTPVWPNLTEIPAILGARTVRVGLAPVAGRWTLDLERLLDAVTPETRLLLLNSPNNPTGWTLGESERDAILAHCRRLGVWILGDDVYERLVYRDSEASAPSFLAAAAPGDRVLSANSFSKAWSMTGFRLGWISAPRALREDLGKLIEYNTSCAPDFIQAAGLAALEAGEAPVRRLTATLRQRRDRLASALTSSYGLEASAPDGGMYVMFRAPGDAPSVAFAKRLIREARLGLAPGAAFGPEAEGWLRWCFAVSEAALEDGVTRLGAWLSGARTP